MRKDKRFKSKFADILKVQKAETLQRIAEFAFLYRDEKIYRLSVEDMEFKSL